MNNYKPIETKLWNDLSMLTSGVLTSLIYELLSGSSYQIDIEGRRYEITSIGMSGWCSFGLVVITFLGLWTLISVLIPWLLRIKQRFTYDKIKNISVKELIRTLNDSKASVKDLYPIFCAMDRNDQSEDLIKLHCRDLAKSILLLQRKFLPQNKRLRKNIEKHFRQHEHATIISIEQKLSGYELAAVIALLRKMVNQTKIVARNDALLSKDCTEMESALNKLDELSLKFVKEDESITHKM